MMLRAALDLPFYLRLGRTTTVRYEQVCREAQIPELVGRDVEITFARRVVGDTYRSGLPVERTTISLEVNMPDTVPPDAVDRFAITNCEEIVNRAIVAYQSVTGEIVNAGFITPIGAVDIQLFADILMDGQDIRDRWPSNDINTFPLDVDRESEWLSNFSNQERISLEKLFLTNARASLEKGQYASAVIQCATAVELRTTKTVRDRLQGTGLPQKQIEDYEGMPLGAKLKLPPTDVRSLATYFGGAPDFPAVFSAARLELVPLRNDVAHRGYLPWNEETIRAFRIAVDFLRTVN